MRTQVNVFNVDKAEHLNNNGVFWTTLSTVDEPFGTVTFFFNSPSDRTEFWRRVADAAEKEG